MKKLMILSVSLLVICLQSNAQYLPDSTKYYLSINDNTVTNVLKKHIENVYEWNANNYRKNGIFNVYVSSDNASISMRVIHFYPKNDSIGIVPDYYSYIDEQIVFWYMGKSHLSENRNVVFKEFIGNIYARLAIESDEIPRPLNTTGQKTAKRDVLQATQSISAEDMKKATIVRGVTTVPPTIIVPPTLLIKRNKNGAVSAIEEKIIY
jgi:hypothetical protein